MGDNLDLGELNEAELLDSSDLQDVSDFDPSAPVSTGDTTFDIGDFAAPGSMAPPPSQDFSAFDAPAAPMSPAADFGSPAADFGSPVADFGAAPSPVAEASPVADFGAAASPVADFGSPAADFGSPVADFGADPSPVAEASPVADFGAPDAASPVADFGSPAADFGSPAADFGSDFGAPVGGEDGPIEQYQREHRKVLEQKEQESNERKAREVEEAKKDIAEYFEERKRRTERNREKHSASTQSAQSTPFDAATPWKNISSLVDLDGIPNKEFKDVSRMREILKQVA